MKSSFPSLRLTLEDVALERGGRALVSELSVAVCAGESLIVTGPNGAGKSTLLRVIAGLLRPASGRVHLEGVGEDGDAPGLHAHYVGHADGLKTMMTAGENLAFWATLLQVGVETGLSCRDALTRLGLPHVIDLPIGYLSAGQRRRVALARLLVARRPLWLLDEPTAALDAESEARLVAMVREHLGSGGIAVIATHSPLELAGRELRLSG